MPHIRIPRLLKDGGRVGGDAILEDVQGRVEALITNTQSPPIHLSQRLSPGIMRDASRSAFRPYRPSRPVAGRRERSTRRSQASSRDLLTTDPLPHTTLHLRSKHISMLSMPQLKFVRREDGGACAGCYMPSMKRRPRTRLEHGGPQRPSDAGLAPPSTAVFGQSWRPSAAYQKL